MNIMKYTWMHMWKKSKENHMTVKSASAPFLFVMTMMILRYFVPS